MRPLALLSLSLFIFAVLLSLPLCEAADLPPQIISQSSYTINEGQITTFDDISVKDNETPAILLEVNWDYDDKVDDDGDGNFTNDDELPHFGIYTEPGTFNLTITVMDQANHTVSKTIKVEVIPSGEVFEVKTSSGSDNGRTVAKYGWVAYLVHLKKDQNVKLSIIPQNQTGGLGLVAMTEEGFLNFQFGMGAFEVIKAYSATIDKAGTTLNFKPVADENVYFVVLNGRFENIPSQYTNLVGEAAIKFDFALEMTSEKTPVANYTPAILIIVIGLVVVVVLGAVIYWWSKKPKVVHASIYQAAGVKEMSPEEKMWKEWKDYEEMYGIKHPNAPYSMLQQRRDQEARKSKFMNWPCAICGSTTSYDNITKQYYCYKCQKNVPPKIPTGQGPPPQAQKQQYAQQPQQRPPQQQQYAQHPQQQHPHVPQAQAYPPQQPRPGP